MADAALPGASSSVPLPPVLVREIGESFTREIQELVHRHIPDVCATLGVRCIDTFKFIDELDFTTDWR